MDAPPWAAQGQGAPPQAAAGAAAAGAAAAAEGSSRDSIVVSIGQLELGRGLHSFTYQLSLSRFCHKIHPVHPLTPLDTTYTPPKDPLRTP